MYLLLLLILIELIYEILCTFVLYVPSSPLSDIISFVELVYQVLQRHRKGKKEDTLRTGGGKGPEKHFIFMVLPSFLNA